MENNREKIRINKYLSEAGFCSRQEADRLISQGRVTVEAMSQSLEKGSCRKPWSAWTKRPVRRAQEKVLLLFNKPRGLVCSTKNKGTP